MVTMAICGFLLKSVREYFGLMQVMRKPICVRDGLHPAVVGACFGCGWHVHL